MKEKVKSLLYEIIFNQVSFYILT